MVESVKGVTADWKYDVVSMASLDRFSAIDQQPSPQFGGYVGFNFRAAFGCRVKLVNEAAVQRLGSDKRGKMLFSD